MTVLRSNLIPSVVAPAKAAEPEALARSTTVHVRVIRDVEEWDRLRSRWDDLFDASPTASPPLRFEWLRTWWDLYGPAYSKGGGLRIFTIWRDRELIGALPLYEGVRHDSRFGVRRLGFLCSGEAEFEEVCADYLDLLHRPGEADACIRALAPALLDRRMTRWHELLLDRVSGGSPLIALRTILAASVRVRVRDRGVCYQCDIRGGLDDYLSRLSSKVRKDAKRNLRLAAEANAKFEWAADECSTDEFFDELIMLHQRRWQADGKAGCFSAPRFTEFHRRMLHLGIPKGWAMLARLSCNGVPVAVFQGVVVGKKFDGYIYGVLRDEASPLRAPGNAMALLLKSYLGDQGFEKFDTLLSKPDSHKRRHSTGVTSLAQLKAWRPGPRLALERSTDCLYRAICRSARLLKLRRHTKDSLNNPILERRDDNVL